MVGTARTRLCPPYCVYENLDHLEHQLHRHQHRIIAAHQPALGDTAEIIDQRNIELRLQRAVSAPIVEPTPP
jgi:hypothetical protein